MVSKQPTGSQLHVTGLEMLMRQHAGEAAPPVERWNPPYCGDIGLRIRADGTWMYQGSPIGRKSLVRLFSRVLRRDPDGRYYLVTPVEKVDIAVEDVPFMAVEMEVDGSGPQQTLRFRTNVDDVIRCGAENRLRFAPEAKSDGLKPYLLVRGRLEALLTRPLYYDLVELATTDGPPSSDRLGIWSDGAFFPLEAASS